MNSEEIKEIGQMFLNIQNNNGSGHVGLTDEEVNTYVKELSIIHEKVKGIRYDLGQVQKFGEETETMLKKEINSRLIVQKGIIDKGDSKHWSAGESKEGVSKFAKIYGSFGGVNKHLKRIDSQISLMQNDTEAFQNKLRKDYRELQTEMWDRLGLIESWIQADTSTTKERIRGEIADNIAEETRQEIGSSASATSRDNKEVKPIVAKAKEVVMSLSEAEKVLGTRTLEEKMRDASKLLPELVDEKVKGPDKPYAEKVGDMPVKHLEISMRSINCLEGANIVKMKDLLSTSPRQLLKIRYFGRKCLREVEKVLIQMDPPLCLSFEPNERIRVPSRTKLERIADRILGR